MDCNVLKLTQTDAHVEGTLVKAPLNSNREDAQNMKHVFQTYNM